MVVIVTMESEVQVTGVLAPPCILVNLYPKGFVCIDILYGITGIAANPVSHQPFLLKDLEVAPGVVDSLLEPVTTLSCQINCTWKWHCLYTDMYVGIACKLNGNCSSVEQTAV